MATITSNASGSWSVGATWVGGTKPADGDSVVIAAGHSVLMDEDTSAYTGLLSVTIQGDNTTPAMLYFKDGTSGYLKIRTGGYTLLGTSGTYKGRLLANSDGVWGNTGSLDNAYTAIMECVGTSYIAGQYLDIALYCSVPTVKYTRVYGTKYDVTLSESTVNTTVHTVDLGASPANGTKVIVTTTGTLPGGLEEEHEYWIYQYSGTTYQFFAQPSPATVYRVDLTSVGSGTLTVMTGFAGSSATVNVLDDVTGDSHWSTSTYYNKVVMCNTFSNDSSRTFQTTTLSSIGATSLTFGNTITAAYSPSAKVYLYSRNVAIIASPTTSTSNIVAYPSYSASYSGVFNCSISTTNGPNYGRGILYGANLTLGEGFIVCNCYGGISYCYDCTMSGYLVGNIIPGYVLYRVDIAGTIDSGTYGIYVGRGCKITGKMYNCVYGMHQCYGYCYIADTAIVRGNYIVLGYSCSVGNYSDLKSNQYSFYQASGFNYGNLSAAVYGIYGGNVVSANCTLHHNQYDIFIGDGQITGYNMSIQSGTPLLTTADAGDKSIPYTHINNIDGLEGQIRGGSLGGLFATESAPGSPPVSLPFAYKLVGFATQNNNYAFIDFPILLQANKLCRVKIYEKCNVNPSTFYEEPKFRLFDPAYEFHDSNGIIVEKTAQTDGGNDTNWHTITLEHRPTASKPVILRVMFIGVNSTFYLHWMYELQNASSYALQFRGV